MHSSRMHTVRNSSRLLAGGAPWEQAPPSPRTRPPGAGTPSPQEQESPREQAPLWRPAARHAGMPPTHPTPGDLLQGMLGYYLQGMLGYHHPCGQTHTCKNITFATSLRPVTNITREARQDYKVVNCRIIMLLQIIKLSRR